MTKFDNMTAQQSKIMVESQAIDLRLRKHEAYTDLNLKEVKELRDHLNECRDSFSARINKNKELLSTVVLDINKIQEQEKKVTEEFKTQFIDQQNQLIEFKDLAK